MKPRAELVRRIFEASMAAGWDREQTTAMIDQFQENEAKLEQLLAELREMNR